MNLFGVVEFEFGWKDDLNKNAIVDTWMEDNPIFSTLLGKTT